MCHHCDYSGLLETSGLGHTTNRHRVFEVIGNNSTPLSAQQIFDTLNRTDNINRVTVYRILDLLVEKRLVACAQVIGPIMSTYWWREKIEEAEEWLCIMKSREDLYGQIEKTLKRIHPYDEPEILATPVVEGSRSYLAWLDEQVTPVER